MRKKILFIIPSLTGGGAEKVLIDILQNMDYSLYEVTLCVKWRTGPYLKDIPSKVTLCSVHGNNNLKFEKAWNFFKKIHFFYVLRKLSLYGIFHSLFYKSVFRALLKDDEFDTVISFMEGESVKFHSYIMDKAPRHISWIHTDLKKNHWSLDFFFSCRKEFEAYRQMTKIICVSEDARRSFISLYPRLTNNAEVVYNPIDRSKIIRDSVVENVTKRKFTICMVGRLNEQKRYDRALEVVRKLKDYKYDIELWVLGEGEMRSILKQTVKDLHIEDMVVFLGFRKSPYSYMKSADLYLNTSDAEGFSLALCEAFCLGIPAVCTKTTGPKELIGQSGGGLLTENDVDSIFCAIQQMIDDKTLRNECAMKALSYSERFDIANTMQQIYQII